MLSALGVPVLLPCTSAREIRLCIFDDDERERGIQSTLLRKFQSFPSQSFPFRRYLTYVVEGYDKFPRFLSSERSFPSCTRVRILKRIEDARFHNSVSLQFDTLQIIGAVYRQARLDLTAKHHKFRIHGTYTISFCKTDEFGETPVYVFTRIYYFKVHVFTYHGEF